MTDNLHVTPSQIEQPLNLAPAGEQKAEHARALIKHELNQATGDIVVTNSFQAEDMVVLHIVRQTLPDVPVVFLDTGYHFAEVYE